MELHGQLSPKGYLLLGTAGRAAYNQLCRSERSSVEVSLQPHFLGDPILFRKIDGELQLQADGVPRPVSWILIEI